MSDNRSRSTRVGFLADGDPNTEMMSALYEYDATGVRLHVPFLMHDDPRSRWWSHGMMHMDDPHRTKYSYQPPSELDYFDNNGPVGLLGCVSGSASTNIGPGVGRGTVSARFAVEKAHAAANYVKINGLRSEIDGLGYWLAFSAHETTIKIPKSGEGVEITTTMKAIDDLPLARRMNLKAVAIGSGPGGWSPEAAYRSSVFLESLTKAAQDWEEHLDLHTSIRNLVRVAAWRPTNFQSHLAASLAEDIELKGVLRHQWREVQTATTGITEGVWTPNDRFLFYYSDIGTRGIARWIKLVAKFDRGITPLVGLLDLEGATVDAFISQLGIALEAIGYESLIESGKTPAQANRTQVSRRIDHLLLTVAGNLSFAAQGFGDDFAESYNSVKHANRAPIAPEVKLRHVRQGVELLRVWIALRLGVTAATLASRR